MTKSIDITMPSLGSDMSEGMLVEWLIKVGDKVKHGDVIAVLETQKGAIDMEAYHDGIVTEILVKPLNTVPVGKVLARLKEINSKQNASQPDESLIETIEKTHDTQKVKPIVKPVTKSQRNDIKKINKRFSHNRIAASPIVRKAAKEHQLDLSIVSGSGFNGAIILKDITAQLNEFTHKINIYTNDEKSANMRSAIASTMSQSKHEIPHFYLSLTIAINNAQRWLQQTNQDKAPQEHILLIAVLLKAVATTLRKYTGLNGFYRNGQFEPAKDINIANVISLRSGGVVVPSLPKVDQLSVLEIMQAIRDMTFRSRAIESGERLRSSELSNTSITITNMGERGAESVFGIIYPPQVAIIGFGKIKRVPQVSGELINIGEQLTVCLSADHRVVDGILGAKFLNSLAKKLQNPEQL
jgi:pyruvate dehydrogenase E2 component (dihydrolipoamide acetyltransferase)